LIPSTTLPQDSILAMKKSIADFLAGDLTTTLIVLEILLLTINLKI
jgi:hypothetical protein